MAEECSAASGRPSGGSLLRSVEEKGMHVRQGFEREVRPPPGFMGLMGGELASESSGTPLCRGRYTCEHCSEP